MTSRAGQARRLRSAWARQRQLEILLRRIEREQGSTPEVAEGIEAAATARSEIREVMDELLDEALNPEGKPPANS